MDEQQQHEQQQQPGSGDPNAANSANPNQRQLTDEEIAKNQEAARQQGAGAGYDPNKPTGAGFGTDADREAMERQKAAAADPNERRRLAFQSPNAATVQAAINDVNAFINAMDDCDADTPEEMLADSDVQQAAVRARNGLKVFTGETPVTFSKPTSDAHLNVGSGGAVTGNTPANRERAAAVREQHGDPVAKPAEEEEEEDAVTVGAGTKVPQPDAHVR